ncbi:MFS transporter [Halorubrum sp. SD626R]|jgi:MFS family permease|uniref:MFS transporter n=1 Tax=Halorubrum sp. SD626R TaxID=1419722 RepID=UPI000A8EB78F|nr:MFS transporter [Halorubrum sp. SD626R]TKX80046.1 MFS transporter [Halorubrum sp. SD626R]
MDLRRIGDYDVLILVSLIWFLGKFVRYLFPPLFGSLQSAYGVSNATIGTAFSGFMVAYALMQFPSGAVADRIGPIRVIVAGASVAGVGALALVVDSPFAALVAAMVVIGAGTGVHKTVAVRLLARVYPTRTGRMLGVHDTLGALSGIAAPAAVVVVLAPPAALALALDRLPGADWRALFLLTGVAAVSLAVAFALRIPGRLPSDTENQDDDGADPGALDYLRLFRNPRFSAFVLVTIGFSFAHNGLVAFLPLYLSREVGLATTTANLLYSLVFAVTFVQLATGDLSDRVGRFPVMVATLGLAAAALAALVIVPGVGVGAIVAGVVVALFGLGSHGFQPVRSAYLMEVLPDWLAGGGLGVVRTLLMGAGALAPAVVGTVADAAGFRPAFALLAGSMALAAVAAAGLWLTE